MITCFAVAIAGKSISLFLVAVAASLSLVVGTLTARSSIGDNNQVAHAADNSTATAGGTGDATEVVGQIIDRGLYGYPQSAAILLGYKTALSANKALNVAWHLEHSDASDMTAATDLVAVSSTQVAASVAGGTVRGVSGNDVDLGPAKRYIRFKYTPDLTATGTDTVEFGSSMLFAQV